MQEIYKREVKGVGAYFEELLWVESDLQMVSEHHNVNKVGCDCGQLRVQVHEKGILQDTETWEVQRKSFQLMGLGNGMGMEMVKEMGKEKD